MKITLTGAPETMLATLYGRAQDAKSPNSVLHDHYAAAAVARIDYDFSKTKVKGTQAIGVALRARQLDVWTSEFLAAHHEATVLHLACGLDTRVFRIDPPDTVRWIDVDYPDVIALRRTLLPERGGDYRMIDSSVTDEAWLESIPADRPTLAVFEGLTMYLTQSEGQALIRRITGRFPSGQLAFDCYGTIGIKLQKLVPAVRNAGATLHWGIDDPAQIELLRPGLRCIDDLRSTDVAGEEYLPLSGRIQMKVISHVPALRDIGRIMRFSY
ncbi:MULTISPECIES: class I SAM-dependent methyltransferase [unclassified Mycobacteroides]|uniref:class I SAM-dependent methyltransferase n=1 Tax=unclassified Mycobacteroides TaxID=2618759 RepID=UPI0013240F0B|nr:MULTISPECIES: class I SAM-dependent methyltransferase [unclassified Mycobacteroides]MUM18572.1 polyketide synthase [Mycobacteroides sp. CBMA 326]